MGPRPDVCGVAIVGSWARGEARADSDLDLVILTEDPSRYTHADDWLRGVRARRRPPATSSGDP
ncbi:MAG: nucleotidyltransferase domain-containing protein [Actinomycetota bacterium]